MPNNGVSGPVRLAACILAAGIACVIPLLSCSPGPTSPAAEPGPNPWTWSNPLPFGYDLNGVYAAARHEVWAVGEQGTVVRFDGWQSRIVPVGTTADLYAIHGTSRDNIFAVGDGVILRFDGTYWRSMDVDGYELRGVHCRGPADVVAVGRQAILHYDGAAWREMARCPYELRAVTTSRFIEGWIFAVGRGVAASYDGFAWTFTTLPNDVSLVSLQVGSPWCGWPSIVAGGQRGSTAVLCEAGIGAQVSWTIRELADLPAPVQAICSTPVCYAPELATPGRIGPPGPASHDAEWAEPTRSVLAFAPWYDSERTALLFAVGTSGTMLLGRWLGHGFAWEAYCTGPGGRPERLTGLGGERIHGLGGGRFLEWDGTAWSSFPTGTESPLRDLWADPSGVVYAVGGNGVIVRRDASGTVQLPGETTDPLVSVWGSAPDDVWVTGVTGLLLHYDGSAWAATHPWTGGYAAVIRGRARDDAYVANGRDAVMRWDGGAWSTVFSRPQASLDALWVDPDSPLILVGGYDLLRDYTSHGALVCRFDGTNWETLTAPDELFPPDDLLALGRDDIYAGTVRGLWHYDGHAWSRDPDLGDQQIYGLYGRRDCGLFVSTEHGIMHRDLN